jgi:hypothetical protein
MKKFISILSLVLLVSMVGTAQTKKVDIDNEWFNYSYRASPSQPRDPVFFHYATSVTASSVVKNNISVGEIEEAMVIEGQRKAANPEEAQLSLELILGNIVISNSGVVERREDIKDRDGKITGTNIYYSVKVSYTFDATYNIKAKGGEALAKGIIYGTTNGLVYTSTEYAKGKDAADYWNNNREVLISGFYRNLSLESAAQLSSIASSRYGFKSVKGIRDIIKKTDEKKHDENVNFKAAAQTLKDELQAMTPNTPMNRDKIDGLIKYFKSIPEKYTDEKLKADISLRYAAYYNLCKIYIYLDEPNNVAEYADLLLANGMDTKDCEKLKKAANELKANFDKTGVASTHFNPDIYFPEE